MSNPLTCSITPDRGSNFLYMSTTDFMVVPVIEWAEMLLSANRLQRIVLKGLQGEPLIQRSTSAAPS